MRATRILPLALLAVGASLTLRLDKVMAAVGETPAAPAAAAEAQGAAAPAAQAAPAVKSDVPSRVGVAIEDDLASRRAGLDARQRQLDMRERLLEATEKRLNAKLASLKQMEARARVVVREEETRVDTRYDSLVKMYQSMKPKEAARIFERLDMPVQVAVATRMKERTMAAIMTDMDPEAAKALTMALAERPRMVAAPQARGGGPVASQPAL